MNRVLIDDVKCGVKNIGPGISVVIAEAKVIQCDGNIFYLSLSELEGIPSFSKTPESIYDLAMGDDEDAYVEAFKAGDLEVEDYYAIKDEKSDMLRLLFMYLSYIVVSDWNLCEKFIIETKGKYLDEIIIPELDLFIED